MQPSTGQTSAHRLQPTHSVSSTHGTRYGCSGLAARAFSAANSALGATWPACGFVPGRWMHWCAPSWHATWQSWHPMHVAASIFATTWWFKSSSPHSTNAGVARPTSSLTLFMPFDARYASSPSIRSSTMR